jgi:hypothetical protein
MRKRKYIWFNIGMLGIVAFFYILNNRYMKAWTHGLLDKFLNYYFNDMICPGALLALTNLFLMFYIPFCKRILVFPIPFLHRMKYGLYHLKAILTYCILCGVYWEFIYPIHHSESTSDVVDILCYALGGTLYYVFYRACIEKKDIASITN